MKIAVIDYGMGNLRSVQKALQNVGADAVITSDPRIIKKCDKIVFPGVGAFGEAMAELETRELIEPIRGAIKDGKIFLGLCLGLQLLFEKSEEARGVKGLSILDGEVVRFKLRGQGLKVPHMGWNNIAKSAKRKVQSEKILSGIADNSYVYFVHSYYVKPKDKNVIITKTKYGIEFASGIQKENVFAFQFHPEKSQELGLRILKNFVSIR